MRAKKVLFYVSILIISFTTITITHAQTTYEDNPGFFTPVVESFYLQNGIAEDVRLVGPAIGYRINNQYDVSLHTEYLSTQWKLSNSGSPELSI